MAQNYPMKIIGREMLARLEVPQINVNAALFDSLGQSIIGVSRCLIPQGIFLIFKN
jgi:hypothetical protein